MKSSSPRVPGKPPEEATEKESKVLVEQCGLVRILINVPVLDASSMTF